MGCFLTVRVHEDNGPAYHGGGYRSPGYGPAPPHGPPPHYGPPPHGPHYW